MIDLPRRLILVLKNSSSRTQYLSHCLRSLLNLTGISFSSSSCAFPCVSPCATSSPSSDPVPASSCPTPERENAVLTHILKENIKGWHDDVVL